VAKALNLNLSAEELAAVALIPGALAGAARYIRNWWKNKKK